MDKLLIIDGNSLLNRAFYALPLLTNSDGVYTNAVFGFCNMLIKIIQEQKPTHIVVAMDYERKTFRNEIYSDYKGTRGETPSELGMQFSILQEVLDAMDIKTIKIQGIEADDIIGTLAKRFKVPTIILTGDRDSLQLIDDTTDVWLTKKGISEIAVMNKESLMSEYGITPSQVIDVKALMGDKSDNIPGVRGVGEVSAYKLIREYGTLDNVYEHLEDLTTSLKNKLSNDKDMAYLSYTLATIKTDCDIDCELKDCKYQFPFSNKVKLLFVKYQFAILIKKDNLFLKDENLGLESCELQEVGGVELGDLLRSISSTKKLALYLNDKLHICIDGKTDYALNLSEDMLGMNDQQKGELQKILNKNIDIVVYGKKDLRRKLGEIGLQVKACFDAELAQYLIGANDKALDIKQFCIRMGFESEVVSIYNSYEKLLQELKDEDLYELYTNIEAPLTDILYDMEDAGIKLDMGLVKDSEIKYDAELKELTEYIYELAGHSFNINSPKQMGEVLFNELKLYSNKKHSTAIEHLEMLKDSHPIIPLIIRYRKILKMKNTYIDNYIKYEKNGFIHTTFNQMSTATGRLSSTDPNMQNIPARDDEARLIRNMFVSRFDGGELISADYSQIELRLMASFSKDPGFVDAFLKNEDIHASTASKIYGIPIEYVTKEQRRDAKAVNFGIIYGQGAFGLSKGINTDFGTAQRFIDSYFETYPFVKKYIDECKQNAKENNNVVHTLFKRKRRIPELSSSNRQLRLFGERVAINTPLQGTASDIIKIAMIRLFNSLKEGGFKSKLVLQIHDELVVDAPKEEIETVSQLMKDCMMNAVKLDIPLTVDINSGKTLLK